MDEFKIEIVSDSQGYMAKVYASPNNHCLTIRIGSKPHLWHVDILLAAYRLYWSAKGLRSDTLNVNEGVHWLDSNTTNQIPISKCIVNFVCRMDDPEQPNTLRKLSQSRYVYIETSQDKTKEIFVAGGITNPYFFVRTKKDAAIIARFDTIEEARSSIL